MQFIILMLKPLLPAGSFRRWLLESFCRNPIGFPLSLIRSLLATRKLTGKFTPLKIKTGVGQTLNVQRSKNAEINIAGVVSVNPWGGISSPSSISIGDGGVLNILGDFDIGPGVHLSVDKGASLVLGGKRSSTASGITANSRVMVERSVEIGVDCIIAWDVVISDSDWHNIKGVDRNRPIVIGDNVWIAHGVSILKGAQIPSGCIVGAKSLLAGSGFSEKSLLAGVPATVRRTGVEWSR